MSAAVGADVEALCAKCGDVWHVVVAKVGAKIVKVQCKQCSQYHRYKAVAGAAAEKKLPATNRAPKAPRASRDPVERFEKPAVAADLSKPVRVYKATDKYEVGDRIDHPTFGQGVIEISEPSKITVFFATGRRVLVQSKEGGNPGTSGGQGGLTRPKPFDYSNAAGGKRVSDS